MEQGSGGGNVVSGGSMGPVVQVAGSVGRLVVQQGPSTSAPTGRVDEDPWVRRARESSVWDHVPSNRKTDEYRAAGMAVTERLADLRDEARELLAEDPWQDPEFAIRFADRVEWMLGEPGDGTALDLYPAEAALLVLAPFLYQVHALRTAARRLDVEPWKLAPSHTAHGSARAAFEAFTDGHGLLVQRALLRRESETAIGWWLFHRWLVRYDGLDGAATVTDLLREAGAPDTALGEALAPDRVGRLLHGLRRGPDVCNPEYLDTLPADDRLRGPGHQRVRDQRLVLLTALAYSVSVEMTALPDVVAEHLGIPHPVDLGELRTSLEESSWGGSAELPVLRAACAHEAVIEGLRAYIVRADELLHAVNRTARERVTQPMPALPSRLSSDGVCPSGDAFTGWASFRLDERRIRDLLMGVQLYKDRDLAVRELYQNALDACRYRKARTEYLDRTHPAASYTYEGRISFDQDVDDDGREYMECRDNGIGMGEAELRGVFSNAGTRFAEQPDFKEERALWARLDPPVPFYPNSRFGIGVLSYFMLADEIRVTTCRMRPDGTAGQVLEVSIFGPGHLFRIVRVAERGDEPGTTVRLYLRKDGEGPEAGDATWSCPDVLRRLLGIAEFPTVAHYEGESFAWPPRVLVERDQPDRERFGLDTYGPLVPWPDAPDGAQVIWCSEGGALLVDGLVVHPSVQGDVLSSHPSGLTGVVVNLSGQWAPDRLSADRTQVLDDLRAPLRNLLEGAVGHLVADLELLDIGWLHNVADGSVALADLITAECIAQARVLVTPREHPVEVARTGCLPADHRINREFPYSEMSDHFHIPDHVYLWRLIAHGGRQLELLTQLCSELGSVDSPLPALPSDHRLLEKEFHKFDPDSDDWFTDLLDVSADTARSPRDTAFRAARLNLLRIRPEVFPQTPPGDRQAGFKALHAFRTATWMGEVTVGHLVGQAVNQGSDVMARVSEMRRAGVDVPDAVCSSALMVERDAVLRRDSFRNRADWFTPGKPVHPAELVSTAFRLGLGIPELCARLASCGLAAGATGLPREPSHGLLKLLSEDLDGYKPWLSRSQPVPFGHVLKAAEQRGKGLTDAMSWYACLGFIPPEPLPELIEADDEALLLAVAGTESHAASPPLRPGGAVQYMLVLEAASTTRDRPLKHVIARLRAFGFPIPLRIPKRMTELDKHLLAPRGALSWHDVTTVDVMPFANVIEASGKLLRQPKDIAKRLAELGVETSCPDLPAGLSFAAAQQLLPNENDLYGSSRPLNLQFLAQRAESMGITVQQAYDWLTALGSKVPDPTEAIRAAIPLIPRADACPSPWPLPPHVKHPHPPRQ